jgi:hypothetical protein
MTIIVPGQHQPGDPGHTTDHNTIRQALLDLEAQTVKVARTPATGRWLLTSQDGGTLEVGDTGWRNAPLVDPAMMQTVNVCRLRRTGNQVTFAFRATVGTGTLAGTLGAPSVAIPAGFQWVDWAPVGLMIRAGLGYHATIIANFWSSRAVLTLSPASIGGTPAVHAAAHSIEGQVSWVTDDAWPSTLPGTAHTQPRSAAPTEFHGLPEEHEPHPTPIERVVEP